MSTPMERESFEAVCRKPSVYVELRGQWTSSNNVGEQRAGICRYNRCMHVYTSIKYVQSRVLMAQS